MLRLAKEIANTEAEGPGRRYAIWVQGCPMRCPGCCNPGYLPFEGGYEATVEEVLERILAVPGLEGVSFLGGEPMTQAPELQKLAEQVRARGLTVMVFSGFTMKEIREDPHKKDLLGHIDLLVDGRYNKLQPDTQRRWIGSRNQGLHFLTNRYSPLDPRFSESNTVEIRLTPKGISINGWPHESLL